jgi:hypothetical protein
MPNTNQAEFWPFRFASLLSAEKYSPILYEYKSNSYTNLSIQTSKLPIVYNGLPHLEYKKNSIKELAHYKLPLSVLNSDDIKNSNNDEYYNDVLAFENAIKPLTNLIKNIDSFLSDENNKKILVGDDYQKCEYIPLYKEVDLDDLKSK